MYPNHHNLRGSGQHDDIQFCEGNAEVLNYLKNVTPDMDNDTPPLDWTEETFPSMAMGSKIKTRPSILDQVNAASIVLNWYVSGIQRRILVPIETVIVGMTTSGDANYVFGDEIFDATTGIELEPQPAVEMLTPSELERWRAAAIGAGPELPPMNPMGGIPIAQGDASKLASAVPDTTLWYKKMWELLHVVVVADSAETAEQTAGRRYALNYIGYICLLVIRGVAKNHATVIAALEKNLPDRVTAFWPYDHTMPKPPMGHDISIRDIENALERGSSHTRRLLVNLIQSSLTTEPTKRGILMSGCMKSLQDSGLGALHWVFEASRAIEVEPRALMEAMFYGPFIGSTMVVGRFLSEAKNSSRSWKWARVLNDGYLTALSVKNNKIYVATLVALVAELKPDHAIWNIPSLALSNWMKHRALEHAQSISAELYDAAHFQAGSTSGKNVIARIRLAKANARLTTIPEANPLPNVQAQMMDDQELGEVI
nr:VP1 [Lye Green virus]